MRVCHVIESASGGAGQAVIDLALFGAEQGDAVTVICGRQRADTHFIETFLAAPGITFVFSSMRRELGLHDLIDGYRLYRELRKQGPFDIIHGHSSKAGALVRLVGLFFPNSVKVYTAHGFITLAPHTSRVFRWIERFLSFFCDAIVAVSEGERRHALAQSLPSTKCFLIPNGTRIEDQQPREKARQNLNIAENDTVLGFVGRMEHPKNPALAIEAFALATQTYPHLKFDMIGEGSLLDGAKAAVNRHNLGGKVRLLGYRNGRQLMAAFDALVCSSDYETLPITFLEALTAGVPIITCPVNGVEEALIEGETGFLATSPTAEGLAHAMKTFAAASQEQRRLMQKNALERARLFSRERMGEATRRLYDVLMEKRSRPAG